MNAYQRFLLSVATGAPFAPMSETGEAGVYADRWDSLMKVNKTILIGGALVTVLVAGVVLRKVFK